MRKLKKFPVTVVICMLVVCMAFPIVAEAKTRIGMISQNGSTVTIESEYLKISFRGAYYDHLKKKNEIVILLGAESYKVTLEKNGDVYLALFPTGSYKVPKKECIPKNKPDCVGKPRRGKEDFFLTGWIRYRTVRYYPKTRFLLYIFLKHPRPH